MSGRRIAVIGGGIAGLSAAWAISQRDRVTLFDAHSSLGMDAHSIDVQTEIGPVRVDVPLRVFHEGYYPLLTALYRHVGVEFVPIDSSASFSSLGGTLHFRYVNYQVGDRYIPFVTPRGLTRPRVLRIGLEAGRFFARLESERRRADVQAGISFGEYVDTSRRGAAFLRDFLVPACAGICTCSYASIRAFPASVVLDYLDSPRLKSMQRALHGARDVVDRLTRDVAEVICDAPVRSVQRSESGVEVRAAGAAHRFDHVVFATQATRIADILDASAAENDVLGRFAYETNELIVHTDRRLAPTNEAWWSPVNYLLEPSFAAPMTTIVLNKLHPTPWPGDPVFQTWNPVLAPDPATVLCEASFERAVVNDQSAAAIRGLRGLHDEPNRRVWFCGSYAHWGMTLQEAAAVSAFDVARRLGTPADLLPGPLDGRAQ